MVSSLSILFGAYPIGLYIFKKYIYFKETLKFSLVLLVDRIRIRIRIKGYQNIENISNKKYLKKTIKDLKKNTR